MDAKNRKNGYKTGQWHHQAKLSDHEVELLRQLRAEGLSIPLLAAKFDISRSHVWRILHYVNR